MAAEQFVRSVRLPKSILIVIIVLSTLVLGPMTSGAQTKDSYHATFSYDCCSAFLVNTIHHPGDVLKLRWIRLTNAPTTSKQTGVTIVLSASISGPFANVASLKSAFARSHPKFGEVNSKAAVIRISNRKFAKPVSSLRIPAKAGKGYYELTTSVAGGSVTQTSGSIICISP